MNIGRIEDEKKDKVDNIILQMRQQWVPKSPKNANDPISIPDTQGSLKSHLSLSCIRLHQARLVQVLTKKGWE